MHFYIVTLNIIPPVVCVENYRNKNSIISYLWLSLLSPLGTGTQSYTKSLKLKLTNKNVPNVIYKIKSYFPQPVQGAGYTTNHFVLLLWKLDCCILQRLERESRFLFSKKYIIFLKLFINSSEGIWQGQLSGGRRGEWGVREASSSGRVQSAPLL